MKKKFPRQINGYSWSIIVVYICASIAMQYHAANISFEGVFHTLPLIMVAVYWCEASVYCLKKPDHELTRKEAFTEDLFAISFSFFLGCLLSLLFQYNNSDAKGWWSLYLYYIGFYGLVFSFLFSLIGLIRKHHKLYTNIFSLIIIFFLSFSKFFPSYISVVFIGKVDSYFVITGSLLFGHFLFFVFWKLSTVFISNTSR